MGTCGQRAGGYDTALSTDDMVVSLLYTLLRDHISAGVLETIVFEIEQNRSVHTFSNDWLAAYASELAWRLRGVDEEIAREDALKNMNSCRVEGL